MILGIDLGTTNSLAAVFRDGAVELIPNALGGVLTPSAVSVAEDDRILVGLPARERLASHPARSAAAFKRAMGTQHGFMLGKRGFRAEELSALVLASLKEDAERHLGRRVTEAVITVPAYFSDAQRKATRTAGQLAGLTVNRLLNEPTAAALAYGLHQAEGDQHVLVLDLGGGTFDVSLLEMFEGVMEVRATAGDNLLGGEDFVEAIMDHAIAECRLPPRAREKPVHAALRRAAEIAKRALSETDETAVAFLDGAEHRRVKLTRDRFEELAAPLLTRLRAPTERALRDAKLAPDQITHLVLAGGATRMPVFRRWVARTLQRLPVATIDPDEVVARGAAVQAGLLARDAALEDRVVTDVTPFTLGIEVCKTQDGRVVASGLYMPIIERNTIVPASRSRKLHTAQDRQKALPVRVYQGESRRVEDNIPLGEFTLPVPLGAAGEQAAEVRFTYDASGLIEVEAKVESTGVAKRIVIENQPGAMSQAEIDRRFAALSALKIHPRDQAENQAVLARAERLYAERTGEERDQIGRVIDEFRILVDKQEPADIAAERERLSAWLDTVDVTFFR